MKQMRALFRLIKSIISTGLILAGTVAIVVLFAVVSQNFDAYDPGRLLVDQSGLAWLRLLFNTEAWSLYSRLQPRVDEINTPVSTDSGLVPFVVEEGQPAVDVAARLQAAGLISDAGLFIQLLQYNGLETRLQAGGYQIRRNLTMRQVGAALARGRAVLPVAAIPPGWRMEQVAEHLAATEMIDGSLFLQQARLGTGVNHPLLVDRPPGQSFEGYLFPGTYSLADSPTPNDLIARMLANMADQLPPDTPALARQRGLTFYQVLTLASIVEREAALVEEKPIIASVYLNRLRPENNLPYLQADPTVQYALGYQRATRQWWKTPVQLEEYQAVKSPYNTYLYPGLPPGPIASPGPDSIVAVLRPAETEYLFFVCRQPHCEGGNHVFARTYEEHLQNVQVYWGQ